MQSNRIIPQNIIQGRRILGFRIRNLAEGAIDALLFAWLISGIPFVPKVRWIITICVGLFLIIVTGIGIKGLAPSQVIIKFLSYRKFIKSYSYRRPNYANKKQPDLISEENGKSVVNTIAKQKNLNRAKNFLFQK